MGADTPTRNKLYPAMIAAGPENFTFEVIEECDRAALDAREDYWQDYFKAKELYEKACIGGYADGCFDLGNMYYYGDGVKQDKNKALNLFDKSCNLNYQIGCDWYNKVKKG